jgi:mRNA (guanine-N7-)-methyltransferase
MHGYYNPFEQLLKGEYKVASRNEAAEDDEEAVSRYMAKPFIPSDPFDDRASLCNIYIDTNYYKEDTNVVMYTEDGQPFEENMIVEFRYDMERTGAWRWVPIRVRHDKTAQMRPTAPNKPAKITANDYSTANSNWYSIHHPITEQMIRTGNHTHDIPIDESVYYTRRSNRSESTTRALRDFHNLYVKSKLIKGTTQRNDTLIDFAVGRAGDLAKWRTSQLSFVLGVDISKDNIMHKTDGACVRYLNDVSKYPNLFDGVFFTGNSALNLRNGDAFTTHKEKKLTQAIFGEGPKVREDLGPMVHRNYGVAKDGFHVASCQFSLHYFFENMRTLHGFARNVAECTRIGGTFIGTCWDGKRVFQLLERKMEGESYILQGPDGDKMMEIAKMYSETGFPDDELSLGYRVNVYQESIGQYIPEYLVNFDFFVRFMENYGFVLAEQEDLARMGLPSSNGSFEQLYQNMRSEIRQNPRVRYGSANEMTEQEQTISFLNRYFVFKKVRNVSTEKIAKLLKMTDTDVEDNNMDTEETTVVAAISKSMKKKRTLKEREEATKAKEEPPHWIRKLDKHAVTIGKYEPVMEEIHLTKDYPEEINTTQEAPIQLKPAIAPVPKIVRTGKKLVLPKN